LLPGEVKSTLFALATWANADGSGAFPSQARIGEAIGKSERSVREHLRLAVDAGWVARSRRGKGRTTRYTLTIPDRQPIAGHADNRQPIAGKTGSPPPPTTTKTTSGEAATRLRLEDLPLDEHRVEPDGSPPLDDPSTNGDTLKTSAGFTLDDGPKTIDDALALGKLRPAFLPADARDRVRAVFENEPYGRAIVAYCAKNCAANVDRFVELLDDERVAYSVRRVDSKYNNLPSDYATADEAAAHVARLRDSGSRHVAVTAHKGYAAEDLMRPF
jgi:biotin operon repressor